MFEVEAKASVKHRRRLSLTLFYLSRPTMKWTINDKSKRAEFLQNQTRTIIQLEKWMRSKFVNKAYYIYINKHVPLRPLKSISSRNNRRTRTRHSRHLPAHVPLVIGRIENDIIISIIKASMSIWSENKIWMKSRTKIGQLVEIRKKNKNSRKKYILYIAMGARERVAKCEQFNVSEHRVLSESIDFIVIDSFVFAFLVVVVERPGGHSGSPASELAESQIAHAQPFFVFAHSLHVCWTRSPCPNLITAIQYYNCSSGSGCQGISTK